MKVFPLDVAILAWGVIGTLVLKLMLRTSGDRLGSRLLFFAFAIALGSVPLIALRSEVAEYSAVGVIAAAVAVFWFAILAGRKGNAT